MSALFKIVLLPVWAPILALWWISMVISAPWRMLFYSDEFYGEVSDFRADIGCLGAIGMTLLFPYTLPTSILYTVMVAISSPFRSWILDGIGPD